jgi:hypothetical protein
MNTSTVEAEFVLIDDWKREHKLSPSQSPAGLNLNRTCSVIEMEGAPALDTPAHYVFLPCLVNWRSEFLELPRRLLGSETPNHLKRRKFIIACVG